LSNARGPNNGWEEMAEWTRQGKLWTYPIDNENGQVLKGECDVSFVEHVFLSREIDAMGFAKTGPVREFMELVIVFNFFAVFFNFHFVFQVANGLSKNPYMSISTKRGHLQWFNNYFDEAKMIEIEQMSLLAAQASAELEADIEIAKKSQ
jgi:small subunit ribosomal protein S31